MFVQVTLRETLMQSSFGYGGRGEWGAGVSLAHRFLKTSIWNVLGQCVKTVNSMQAGTLFCILL